MFFGTSPVSRDSDGDGVTDWDEVSSGTDPLNPDDPAPFVPGDTFSFLTQQEIDVVLNMLDGIYDTVAPMHSACDRDVGRDYAECCRDHNLPDDRCSSSCGPSAERGRCDCRDTMFIYEVQQFEAGFSGLMDQMEVSLTITELGEVSAFMHTKFDRTDDCGVRNCTSVSLLCAY